MNSWKELNWNLGCTPEMDSTFYIVSHALNVDLVILHFPNYLKRLL